jgi:hypothetical protein
MKTPYIKSVRKLLMGVLLVIACHGYAATYYVSTTGDDDNSGTFSSPFLTIQRGTNAATAGDLVYVRGGTYSERITISSSGTAANKIVLSGYAAEAVILDGQNLLPTGSYPAARYVPLLAITGSYVELRSLTVKNSRGRGVGVDDGAGEVSNVLLFNVDANHNWNAGIHVKNVSSVTVDSCKVSNNAFSNAPPNRGVANWPGSLMITDSLDCVVKNCAVFENHGEGIIDLRSDNSLIEGNFCYDNLKINIYLDNSQSSIVRKNLVYSSGNTLYWRFSDHPTPGIVVNNEAYSTQNFCREISIVNNLVYNTGELFGIWSQVANSTFQNVTVAHNTFVNTLTGTAGFTSRGIHVAARGTKTNVLFQNNIISHGSGAIASGAPTGVTFLCNNWSSFVTGGFSNSNDVIGNPQLTLGGGTPDADWFKLTALSPAIDQAHAISGLITDYFGATRGVLPDIGGHEFVKANPPAVLSLLFATAVSTDQTEEVPSGLIAPSRPNGF